MPPELQQTPPFKVRWNQVTWYSKLGAIILFLAVIPALSFYIGMQYELTTQTFNQENNQSITTIARNHTEFLVSTGTPQTTDFSVKDGSVLFLACGGTVCGYSVLSDADASTFVPLSGRTGTFGIFYGKDATHVYACTGEACTVQSDVDVASFQVVKNGAGELTDSGKDKNHTYVPVHMGNSVIQLDIADENN